jgi:hypothetical protein
MKAISIFEPWATLIAMGLKQYETRSWETFHRGPLLICAAKKKLPFVEIAGILMAAKLTKDDLNYGKAVAVVDLVDCIPTKDLIVSDSERRFGDFSPGRYAWKFEKIRRFKKPLILYIMGRQGLFDAPMYHNRVPV